ncbi:MAG: thiazole synthase [Dehalococcoidia bacterium]
MNDTLQIAGRTFHSRLILGTGKYRTPDEMNAALAASGTEVVTVAIRRLPLDNPGEKTLLDYVDWSRYTILPNTAGCATPEEALRIARLSRALGLPDWIKLEVIPDAKYLLPDPIGTLEAARLLIAENFAVLPYINDDPVLARRLEEVGCATVMPLAAPIGSGQGMVNFEQIKIIVEQAGVPVVVDAGLGAPSDAALAMEIGASAVLVNSAVALAEDPALMGQAFKLGVEAGRIAYQAGRIPKRAYAAASSPLEGVVR